MDNSFIFDEIKLKRIPHFLAVVIVLLLALPYIGLNLGMNFSVIADKLSHSNELNSHLVESQIRGYFRQTLLQWSGFSLASVTVLLAFTQYRLSNDKIALVIGLSVLFSGSLEALQTLAIDGISLQITDKNNLDALIWIFSNSISGLILIVGLSLLLINKDEKSLSVTTFVLLTIFLILTSITLFFYVSGLVKLPVMWFKNFYLSRPYELVSIGIYLFLMIFIYPRTYKAHPTILSDGIFYIAVTQIVISFYLMLLSNAPYDSAYNIAYSLKIVSYFIPCICLIINYVYAYSAVFNTQKKLNIKQNELKYLASHDYLTNLFNRREFEELLDKSIANSSRHKQSLALMLIDLDNFKTTNDTFGHIHGDELLKQFSKRLTLLIRKGDLLSRVGGDEFTLILANLHSPSSARQLAERILNELNSPYPISGKLITVTASIGISIFPEDGNTTEDLLRKADLAMYKSKHCGKNTYQFYTNRLSYLQHRESEVETYLRKALQNDEFELYYQPKYNLLNQEIIGAEILLRWNNDTLRSISPDEFIPIAESTGLIIDLGHWVLRKAFKQVMKWANQYNRMLLYSINISPVQLINKQFLSNLKQALQDYNYPTKYLEIEITEAVLMKDSIEINRVLNSISALGIKLSLDDFGKGYSSLNRLKTLPIDTLKIDKDFVSDIHNEKDKVIIIDIIIKLANELGMSIIAEGIETTQQLKYLVSKKCYLGQGFLLSKPISADQFAKLAYANLAKKKNIITN